MTMNNNPHNVDPEVLVVEWAQPQAKVFAHFMRQYILPQCLDQLDQCDIMAMGEACIPLYGVMMAQIKKRDTCISPKELCACACESGAIGWLERHRRRLYSQKSMNAFIREAMVDSGGILACCGHGKLSALTSLFETFHIDWHDITEQEQRLYLESCCETGNIELMQYFADKCKIPSTIIKNGAYDMFFNLCSHGHVVGARWLQYRMMIRLADLSGKLSTAGYGALGGAISNGHIVIVKMITSDRFLHSCVIKSVRETALLECQYIINCYMEDLIDDSELRIKLGVMQTLVREYDLTYNELFPDPPAFTLLGMHRRDKHQFDATLEWLAKRFVIELTDEDGDEQS
jgi:hypothetical protein